MCKAEIVFFPGVEEVPEPPIDPEPDFEALAAAREILLERWRALGEELKRRSYDIPADLQFEIDELLRGTRG
jgi:hypothetical protein